MRARMVVLVIAILAVAAFAALNWSEMLRTTPLSFGVLVADAPLGLILLGVTTLLLLAFVVSSATSRTEYLLESRSHSKALEAQRELADKAEASRFTDLRLHLDTQLRENRQREAIAAAEFEKAMVQSQRELRTQLEQMNRLVASRLSEIETRIDARLDRVRPGVAPTVAL
jgi:DNA anti-recombination protein RmuC